VLKINKQEEFFEVETENRKYRCKKIISTINLDKLINACQDWVPAYIVKEYENLIVNPMFVISIGIKGEDTNQFTAIYFPEKEFLVNRISYPCTFSSSNAPTGYYSIQAEITFKNSSDIASYTTETIADHVTAGLAERGLLNRESVIFVDIKRIKQSYVVYDQNYQGSIKIIREYFSSKGIDLLGRFSYFEYINIDMAVERALALSIVNGECTNEGAILSNALEKILHA
jgi:protoporphyrinogen oxidase